MSEAVKLALTEPQKAYHRAYYRKNRDKHLAKDREYRKRHPNRRRETQRKSAAKNKVKIAAYNRAYRKSHPEVNLRSENKRRTDLNTRRRIHFNEVRYRAKRSGIAFELTFSDICWPTICPVLGVPLEHRIPGKKSKSGSDAPSFDRIDSSKGYVRGNVRIISLKANRLKNNATVQELRAILSYMESLNEQT